MQLIDRDALADALGIAEDCSYCEFKDRIFCRKSSDFVSACEAIYEQPIIEERKVGQWTSENACEFCGFQPWYENDIHTLSFCPNCGADMRGEEDG